MSQSAQTIAGAQDLSSDDFFFGNLAEYLDGDLSTEAQARFEAMLKEAQYSTALEAFKVRRGQLQMAFQQYIVTEADLGALRGMVRDPVVVATQEAVKIEALGRGELINTLFRRLVVVALVAGALGYAFWKFGTPREAHFKALEYLGYEAQTLEAEKSDGRLNLPSSDLKEIKQFFSTYPGLAYSPKVLKQLPGGWQPDGATVIDYEIAKVAVVQYTNKDTKERLFHFSYGGELSDLPAAEPGNMRGLVYQTYASDDLNFIAWQAGNHVVSMLVGRRSAPELAELAVTGSGKG